MYPPALGERPERAKPALIDLDLLFEPRSLAARLDRQMRLLAVAANSHLDAVAGQREVPLLDLVRRVELEVLRRMLDQELALDLDSGGHRQLT